MRKRQRRLIFCFILAAALPILVGSAAFACQRLATLSANPRSGPVGTVVSLSGGNYSTASTASPVDVHLDSRTGPILVSVRPGPDGSVSTSFVVPSSMSVAYHTLIATQTNNGVAVSGTPGRTSFQVTSVAAAASSASMFTPVTTIGLLAMAAAGSVMQVVRRRRQTVEA